jgi:uncharacterized protein (TIGR00290 family)
MKAFMNWSGGKDSGFCLFKAKQQGISIDALVTSVNQQHDRVSMHGVRRSLLELQAASIQLPLYTIELPEQPDMTAYEAAMRHTCFSLKQKGFTHSVFGDIFLEDLRAYRETQLAREELHGLFPIWKTDSRQLIDEFISLGFKAVIVCVNSAFLSKTFCGRLIDESFMDDLPPHVDPCGENGEYHSFVFDGPIFSQPIPFSLGEIVYKEYKAPAQPQATSQPSASGFYFQDLLPV